MLIAANIILVKDSARHGVCTFHFAISLIIRLLSGPLMYKSIRRLMTEEEVCRGDS